ncbi:MAG: citramalate synthase [Desulfobacterales bacterium]|nr:citramalate synthase [Desulfobacterales bacterium]
MKQIYLYDTTLRDGTQGENISFTAVQKLKIAQHLDNFGIHYIEGGWPGSNPRDLEFFELAKKAKFKNARLTAFGSTRKARTKAQDDPNIIALLESETPVVTIFGKTWDYHVKDVMRNTYKENLAMIYDSVRYLKKKGREVIYDAEHFFDGYKDNSKYAIKTLKAAVEGGAEFLVLCDTNGGSLPSEIHAICKDVIKRIDTFIDTHDYAGVNYGIHTHNDSGLAVANTLIAVETGINMVQGTINGYGERCGNADLTSIIPNLCLKMDRKCVTKTNLKNLKHLSRYVSEAANMTPQNNRPFIGQSAFAHKGGIHVSAILRKPKAYEHLQPELVGNKRRVLMSDLAGKSNVEYKAKELGFDMNGDTFDSRKIVSEIKKLEHSGFQFDVADASFKLLIEKMTDRFKPMFELKSFRVHIEKDKNRFCSSNATIKISVNGVEKITVAEGMGPVSALDNAIRKALDKFYPGGLDSTQLVDFKVRVIDGKDGTASRVRVLIDSRDRNHIWTTIGVSEDIIEASWQALADSYQYILAKEK